MQCTNCGEINPEQAKFCWQCGRKLPLSSSIFCPFCGNRLVNGFCRSCNKVIHFSSERKKLCPSCNGDMLLTEMKSYKWMFLPLGWDEELYLCTNCSNKEVVRKGSEQLIKAKIDKSSSWLKAKIDEVKNKVKGI